MYTKYISRLWSKFFKQVFSYFDIFVAYLPGRISKIYGKQTLIGVVNNCLIKLWIRHKDDGVTTFYFNGPWT